jgi:hypothetical protein
VKAGAQALTPPRPSWPPSAAAVNSGPSVNSFCERISNECNICHWCNPDEGDLSTDIFEFIVTHVLASAIHSVLITAQDKS